MTSTPLASIVICSYNYERYLPLAIESALSQTYPNVEVIVVDDGSTDGSREIIAGYGNRVIAVLKDNEGHDTAINTGFARSRGDIVCFLDSDDGLFPFAMENIVAAFRDPAVVMVDWRLRVIDQDGRPYERWLPSAWMPDGDLREVVITHGPQSYMSPPTSGNAWARRFLEKVCPIAQLANRAGTADDQLAMLAPLFGSVKALDSQGFFRDHGGNNYWGRSLDYLDTTVRDFDAYCEILSDACRGMGIAVDPDAWRRESWFYSLHTALQEITRIVPAGEPFILIDEDRWETQECIAGRRRLPLVERDGIYWGRPIDDAEAAREMDRLRARGARYLAIGWPAFWWTEFYAEWYGRVQASSRCIVKNDRLQLFEFQAA